MNHAQQQAAAYLQQQLGNVNIVPEGPNSLSVEVSSNAVYFHVDANEFNQAIQSGQPMTCVVSNGGSSGIRDNNPIVGQTAINGGLGSNIVLCCDSGTDGYEILYDVTQRLNVDVSNWNGVAFSSGGPTAVETANNFLTKHPEYGENFDLFIGDGWWTSSTQFEGYDALKEHNVDMYFTIANGGDDYFSVREGYTFNGSNAERIYRENGHNTHIIQSNEIYGETAHKSLGDLTLNLVIDSDEHSSRVTILSYDKEKQGYLKDTLDLNTAYIGGSFSVTLKKEDVELMKSNTIGDNTVLSNTVLAMQHINDISKEMNNNNGLFNPAAKALESTANIASGIVSAQNAYLSISNDLHHRLRLELGLITDITQRYYDMDGDLSSLASTLQTAGVNNSPIPNEIYTNLSDMLYIEAANSVNFFKNYQIPTFPSVESIGTVVKSEIEALANPNGAVMQNLNADMDSAKRTQLELRAFENDIGVQFKGSAYEVVKGNLSMFASLEGIRISSCEKLMSAIKQASNEISNYMGEDTELNTAHISDLRTEITNLETALAEKETKTTWDMWSKTYVSYEVYKLQGAARTTAETNLKIAQAALNKLLGLGPVIQKATEIINDALQDIYVDYGKVVHELGLGNVEPYEPQFSQSVRSGVSTDTTPVSTMPEVATKKYSPINNVPGVVVDRPFNEEEIMNFDVGNVGSSGGYAGASGGYAGAIGGTNSQQSTEETEKEQEDEKDKEESEKEQEDEKDKEESEEEKEEIDEEETVEEDKVEENKEEETEKEQEGEEKPELEEDELIAVQRPTVSSRPSGYDIPSSYVPNNTPIQGGVVDETMLNGVVDQPLDDLIIDETIEEVPIIEEVPLDETPFEEIPLEDTFVEEPIKELATNISKDSNKGGVGKAIATVLGVGAAVGGASYGAHKYIKSKQDNEEYDYSSDEDDY